MRNDYEYKAGSFQSAINSETSTFQEFPKWIDKNLQMLKDKKVYTCFVLVVLGAKKQQRTLKNIIITTESIILEGGILDYLYQTKNKNNLWKEGISLYLTTEYC